MNDGSLPVRLARWLHDRLDATGSAAPAARLYLLDVLDVDRVGDDETAVRSSCVAESRTLDELICANDPRRFRDEIVAVVEQGWAGATGLPRPGAFVPPRRIRRLAVTVPGVGWATVVRVGRDEVVVDDVAVSTRRRGRRPQ